MKLLLVDAGNERLKWALRADAVIELTGFADYRDTPAVAIAALIAAMPDELDAIAVSNVAGHEIERRLTETLGSHFGTAVWLAKSTRNAGGVRNGYARPELLGVDRWAALVGALSGLRQTGNSAPLCVVDAGTALTIDALTSDGAHIGGLILPGLALQRSALLRSTADIAAHANTGEEVPQGLGVFATDTHSALTRSGCFAAAATVDRCVQLLAVENETPVIMLTGGDARSLAPWLATEFEICPNLVFEGLAILFEQRSSS